MLGTEGAPSIPKPVPKAYDLPEADFIVEMAQGPYEGYMLAMAFAGLRIGEAVALQSSDLKHGNGMYWIEVQASRQNKHGRYKKPKGGTRVGCYP